MQRATALPPEGSGREFKSRPVRHSRTNLRTLSLEGPEKVTLRPMVRTSLSARPIGEGTEMVAMMAVAVVLHRARAVLATWLYHLRRDCLPGSAVVG